MKTFSILVALMGCLWATGCSQKTPEEIEAEKYPKVAPNPPEVSRKLREEMDRRSRGM